MLENIADEIARLVTHRPAELGPFDIIGDIHACYDELVELLDKLGYHNDDVVYRHPEGRRVVFLGDLFNRGPDNVGVLRLVAAMVDNGQALYVRGNHCQYIYGYFQHYAGREYQRARNWIDDLTKWEHFEIGDLVRRLVREAPPFMVLDEGRLVATHAGIEEHMIGPLTPDTFGFCLFGENLDEVNEFGFPKRRDWAATYHGDAFIAYGHTPTMAVPEIRFNTVNLDGGCCFGGWMSAMRYPEREFVVVQAKQNYAED